MEKRSTHLACLLAGLLLTAAALSAANKRETPEYIKPCRRSDPDLDNCIVNTFNHLRPYLKAGIAEISVPPIDPLVIDRLAMENGNGPVRIRAVFGNITAYGPANYTIQSVKADVERLRIDLGLTLPRIEVTGKYDVNGQVLLFPVRSRGDFWASFTDIQAEVKLFGKEVTIDGERYMKTEKLAVDFELDKSKFRIKDNFNGNPVLGQALNQFLNQNSNEIIKEMKPAATAAISRHFKSFLNTAFLKIPIAVWLLEE